MHITKRLLRDLGKTRNVKSVLKQRNPSPSLSNAAKETLIDQHVLAIRDVYWKRAYTGLAMILVGTAFELVYKNFASAPVKPKKKPSSAPPVDNTSDNAPKTWHYLFKGATPEKVDNRRIPAAILFLTSSVWLQVAIVKMTHATMKISKNNPKFVLPVTGLARTMGMVLVCEAAIFYALGCLHRIGNGTRYNWKRAFLWR